MIFAPAISTSHSANPSQESPFGFAHSQEEFHTSFAGQVYALWREDQPLLIDFTAHSDVDTNFTWDATGLAGNWGITSNGSTAQVDWQPLLTPGIYELVVTAENSQGQTSVTVWLRISPTSRAWNIRREHTSLYTAHWDGHINTAPVWGANHRGAGYAYFPLDPTCFDCAGSLERYISNGDFIYTAGSTSLYNGGSNSNALINGPQRQLPDGLLTHAAISQLIQGWLQQARDAVEMLNDYIGAFDALLQNQFAQYQYEAEICRRQAEWEASRTWMDDVGDVVGQMWQGVMDTVESDWEFLGIRGRKGGIEFGDLFAIEWAGYGDRAEATWGGAFFQGGDLITLGQYYSDQDRAEMYEYYASRGLENYYMAGGRVSQITITTAAAVATGGAAGGAAGALGARAGYAVLAETVVGSASASAIHQQYTTGEIRGDVLAQDTAIGLAFVGGGRAIGAMKGRPQPRLGDMPGGPGNASHRATRLQFKQFKRAVKDVGGVVNRTTGKPFVLGKHVYVNRRTLTQQQMIDEYAHVWNNLMGRGAHTGSPTLNARHARLGEIAVRGGTDALSRSQNFEYHQLELMNMLGSGHRPAFMNGVSRMELSKFLCFNR